MIRKVDSVDVLSARQASNEEAVVEVYLYVLGVKKYDDQADSLLANTTEPFVDTVYLSITKSNVNGTP